MARYTGPSCRLCRREGQKLFLKGERCYSAKCALEKRAYAPGQHGQNRKKASNYGLQLREKQKAKRFYGLQETQFRNYFEKAARKSGMTGANLLIMLETRLDNAVFRMGFASSRKEARQLVTHAHFTVNGKTTKINGNKQYTWGGPDAELGYYQDQTGELDVSISGSGSFTIWGIGLIK